MNELLLKNSNYEFSIDVRTAENKQTFKENCIYFKDKELSRIN